MKRKESASTSPLALLKSLCGKNLMASTIFGGSPMLSNRLPPLCVVKSRVNLIRM